MPYIQSGEQMLPDKNAAAGKFNSFTEVGLTADTAGKTDTSYLFKAEFYPSGFLKSTEDYVYAHNPRESFLGIPWPLVAKVSGPFQNCLRTTYTYDTNNNLVAKREYKIALKNSFASLDKALDEYARRNRTMHIMEKQSMSNFARFADSLTMVDIPEVTEQIKDLTYSYDSDSNFVSGRDAISGEEHYCLYGYYTDGRVACRKEVIRKSASVPQTVETYIAYAPNGKICNKLIYEAEDDTENIASSKNLVLSEQTIYNKKRLPSRIVSTGQDSTVHNVELLSYKDTLLIKSVKLQFYDTMKNADTVSVCFYTYKNGQVTVTKNRYLDNKIYLVEKEESYYDSNGLLKEIAEFESEPSPSASTERPKTKTLFFYR